MPSKYEALFDEPAAKPSSKYAALLEPEPAVAPAEKTIGRSLLETFAKGVLKARDIGTEALSEFSPELSGRVFGQTTASLRPEQKSQPLVSPENARAFIGELPGWAGGGTQLAKGATEATAEALSSFSSPAAIAQLPAFAVPGVAQTFAANVLADVPRQAERLGTAVGEHGVASQEVGKVAAEAGIEGLMGILAGKGRTKIGPLREQLATLTGERVPRRVEEPVRAAELAAEQPVVPGEVPVEGRPVEIPPGSPESILASPASPEAVPQPRAIVGRVLTDAENAVMAEGTGPHSSLFGEALPKYLEKNPEADPTSMLHQFRDSEGGILNRAEAWQVAKEANQIKPEVLEQKKNEANPELQSQDLIEPPPKTAEPIQAANEAISEVERAAGVRPSEVPSETLGQENVQAASAPGTSDVAQPVRARIDEPALAKAVESLTEAPKEQVESVRKVYGDKDQFDFIQAQAEQARQSLGPGAASSAEFPILLAENAKEYAAIGAGHLLEGRADKASWVTAMREEYGVRDATPTELNKIWGDSHALLDNFSNAQTGKSLRPKTQIERATGINVPEEPTIKESAALRTKMRAEQKAAAEGFRAGKREVRETLTPVIESLRETIANSVTKARAFTEYLRGLEKGSAMGAKARQKQLAIADRWLEADRNAIRTELLDFSMNLPLHERAKFLPAITAAMRRAPLLSKDFDVMYRRAEDVLNRMTAAVYDVKKAESIGRIEKLLTKVEASKSMTIPEKEAIRARGVTFNNLKSKMSLDMLEAMHERMLEIREQGKDLFVLDQVIQAEKVKATLREISDQGVRKIDSPTTERLALGETETGWQRRIAQLQRFPELIKHFNLSLTPIDWMIQTFDKVADGALYKTLKVPMDVRYGEWLDTTAVYKKRLSEIVRKHGLTEGNLDRVYAAAEMRQEGGLENLMSLGYSAKELKSLRLSRSELEYLREADKINNELFPVLKDVLSKNFHQEVDKVQGYFPRQRDWDYYNTLSIEEGKFARAMNRTNTEKGFTVSRVGATTKNITNAHEVMLNHIDDVLYHIKMGPEIRRVADVVKNKEFADNVGTWGQQVFSDWTDVLSRNGGIGSGRRIHALDILRKNVGVAQLAFRLTTTALQPLSIIQGLSVVSPKNMVRALDGAASKSRRKFMLDNFPEIRARVGDDPAYSDYGSSSIRDKVARGGFKAIGVLDRFAALVVGEAAYRDSLAARGIDFDINKVDPKGVQDAQLAVRKTQSSAYPKDVPLAISRGNFSGNASVDKAIFQFQNFLINKWALVKNGGLQMGITEKSPKAGARIMAFLILGTIVEQLARDGIARSVQATVGTTPKQDQQNRKDADKSYALKIGEKAAVDLVTSIPIVSNLTGMAKFEGSGVPVVDTLGNAIEGAVQVAQGATAKTKTVGGIRAVQAVGALAGVPTGQLGDLAVQLTRAASEDRINTLSKKWVAQHGAENGVEPDSGPKFKPLKDALEKGKLDVAKKEYQKLLGTLGSKELNKRFKSSISRPFTGSARTDQLFLESLPDKDRKVYDEAIAHREALIERFNSIQ